MSSAHADEVPSGYRFNRRPLAPGDRVRIGDRTGRRGVVLRVYADGGIVVVKWRPTPNGPEMVGRFEARQLVRE